MNPGTPLTIVNRVPDFVIGGNIAVQALTDPDHSEHWRGAPVMIEENLGLIPGIVQIYIRDDSWACLQQ